MSEADDGLRRAIEAKLKSRRWGRRSTRAIAMELGCSDATVLKVRRELNQLPTEVIFRTRHGDTTTMQIEKIGKHRRRSAVQVKRSQEETEVMVCCPHCKRRFRQRIEVVK